MLNFVPCPLIKGNVMPEYRFSNPYLEDIHNSIVRMHKQVDHLFYLLSVMLEKLNRRDDMQFKDQKKLDESTSYDHPISLKSFGELNNPVLDSEGYIREKGEIGINLGIYSRNPVTVTESSDIKKVQHDYRNLQSRIDNLTDRMDKMMKKWDDEDAKRQQEDAKREQDAKEWENQKAKWVESEKRWAEKEKMWDKSLEEFRSERKLMLGQIDDKDRQLREQRSKNVDLLNENLSLKRKIEKKKETIKNLKSDHPFVDVELKPWKEKRNLTKDAKGIPRNTCLGFQHTFFDSYFPREKMENEVRISAYEGNNERLIQLLDEDSTLANGRGMPDSLGSAVRSWQDKTPLMLASQEGYVNCVKTLLDHGADPNYLDRDNLTALDYAQKRWNKNIANILRENDALNGIDLIDKSNDYQLKEVPMEKQQEASEPHGSLMEFKQYRR